MRPVKIQIYLCELDSSLGAHAKGTYYNVVAKQ